MIIIFIMGGGCNDLTQDEDEDEGYIYYENHGYDRNDVDDHDEHYSKSLGGRPQGTWMGLLTASGSLARCP